MAYPVNTFSFSVNAADFAALMRTWTLGHIVDAGGHNLASQTKAGFMSPLDKSKLDALGGGAGDIGAGEINTVHLANGSVTSEKIAQNVEITGTLTGTASRATADGSGNNIASTYATKSQLNSYVQTTVLSDYLALKLDVTTFNSYKSSNDSALALKATKSEVETALAGKQPIGSYATTKELEDGLATKQAAGNYATKTELTQGLAGKQPTGDYVLSDTLSLALSNKQDKGDYATNATVTQGLAEKQDKGDYALAETLVTELAKKQDKGDYVTPTTLAQNLATKQDKGDYVTTSTFTTELAKKQNAGSYVTTSSLTTTLSGYVTESELETAIAGVSVSDGSITVNKLADVIDLGGLS